MKKNSGKVGAPTPTRNGSVQTEEQKAFELEVQELIRQAKQQLKATSPFLKEEQNEPETATEPAQARPLVEEVREAVQVPEPAAAPVQAAPEALPAHPVRETELNEALQQAQREIAQLREQLSKAEAQRQPVYGHGAPNPSAAEPITRDDLKIEFLNFTSAHIDQFNNRIRKTEEIVASLAQAPARESAAKPVPGNMLQIVQTALLGVCTLLLIALFVTRPAAPANDNEPPAKVVAVPVKPQASAGTRNNPNPATPSSAAKSSPAAGTAAPNQSAAGQVTAAKPAAILAQAPAPQTAPAKPQAGVPQAKTPLAAARPAQPAPAKPQAGVPQAQTPVTAARSPQPAPAKPQTPVTRATNPAPIARNASAVQTSPAKTATPVQPRSASPAQSASKATAPTPARTAAPVQPVANKQTTPEAARNASPAQPVATKPATPKAAQSQSARTMSLKEALQPVTEPVSTAPAKPRKTTAKTPARTDDVSFGDD